MLELARVPGTVCYFGSAGVPGAKPQRGDYWQLRCDDLVNDLDRLVLDVRVRRIVWIEARGQIKAFHPADCFSTIRSAARSITLEGFGLDSCRAFQAFRQGVLPV